MSLKKIAALEKKYQRLREELDFFDAGSWLGDPVSLFPLAKEMPPEQLQKVHRDWNIRAALVSHWGAWNEGLAAANARLAKAIGAMKNSFAIATALPMFPDGNDFLTRKRRSAFSRKHWIRRAMDRRACVSLECVPGRFPPVSWKRRIRSRRCGS